MAWPHDSAGRPLPKNKKTTHESVARYGAAGDLLTTPTDYGVPSVSGRAFEKKVCIG
jgi:hypothetical protein